MPRTLNQWVVDAVPLPVYCRLVRRDVVVFCYHAVSDVPLPHVEHLIPYKSAQAFEQDLVYLKKHFTVVSYEQVRAARAGEGRLPPNAALLTFDDGYAEVYSVVRPLLHKYQVPAVFFLITACLDNRSMAFRNKVSLCIDRMRTLGGADQAQVLEHLNQALGLGLADLVSFVSWIKPLKFSDCELIDQTCRRLQVDVAGYLEEKKPYLSLKQIETLRNEGFLLGGHSREHPNLADLPEPLAQEEIVESCAAVCGATGQVQSPFAFPFSAHRVRREFLAKIHQAYPQVGLMFDTKGVQRDKPFILSRISADTSEGGQPDKSNLPWLLHRAYKNNLSIFLARIGLANP